MLIIKNEAGKSGKVRITVESDRLKIGQVQVITQ